MRLNAYLIYYSIVFVEEEEKNSISERTYIHYTMIHIKIHMIKKIKLLYKSRKKFEFSEEEKPINYDTDIIH